MKFIAGLTFLGLVLILSLPILRLTKRIGEIQATQQAQIWGYSRIEVTDTTSIAAWLWKDCNFPQTTYVQLRGSIFADNEQVIDTISFCINEWTGNNTYSIKNISHLRQ